MEKFQDASIFDSLGKIKLVTKGFGGDIEAHYNKFTVDMKTFLEGYSDWSKEIEATESTVNEWVSIFQAFMTNPGPISNEYLS